MRLLNSHRPYTAPCGFRVKSLSERRGPLYKMIVFVRFCVRKYFIEICLGEVYTVRTQPTFVAMKPSEAGEKGRKRKNQSPTPGKGPNALDF